jgi:hypothetical protein
MAAIDIVLTKSHITQNSNIHILQRDWGQFPNSKRQIEISFNGVIYRRLFNPTYHEFALGELIKSNNLTSGVTLRFIVVKPKVRYNLQLIGVYPVTLSPS